MCKGTTKWRLQWNHAANIQKQHETWPLPSSSISPLPRISSVDSLVEPSFKNSVKMSPVWGRVVGGGESEKCWRLLEQVWIKLAGFSVAGFSLDNVGLLCSQTGLAGVWLSTAVCSGSTALICQHFEYSHKFERLLQTAAAKQTVRPISIHLCYKHQVDAGSQL